MASRDFWIGKARLLALRRNVASWLDVLLPAIVFVSIAAAASALLLRTLDRAPRPVWWWFGAALAAAALFSWLRARRKFLRVDEALVRLDEVGRLHNRLSAARAGVGDWPDAREVREPIRWRWSRLLGPLALSATLLLGAAWLPVPMPKQNGRTTEQPLAWTQVDSWLQTLEEGKLVEPEALGKVREQLEELRQQSPNEWYKQSSLEAGDTLRNQTEQALRGMLQQLEKTEQTLAAAEKAGENPTPAQLQALSQQMQEALNGLEMGNLPLNKEMIADLKKFDPSKAKQLSAQQLSEMRSNVQAGKKVAEQCVRPGANVKQAMLGEGKEAGGEGGGGGPAPLALKTEQTNLRTKATETISNQDTSQALPGDLVGVQSGEHQVEQATLQQIAGGTVTATGEGGEAVRRESFTPQERNVLQRFFK